jgi:hypothetical protein
MCNRSHKFAYEVHRSVASVVAAAARFVLFGASLVPHRRD